MNQPTNQNQRVILIITVTDTNYSNWFYGIYNVIKQQHTANNLLLLLLHELHI